MPGCNGLQEQCGVNTVLPPTEEKVTEKPTTEQLAELRKLSREARVNDWSEVVQTREEAAMRIEDLKLKAKIE
jgi:hypothetical protein